jgi:hypothetical protein
MERKTWVRVVSGLALGIVAVGYGVVDRSGTPEWTCTCEGADRWSYMGPHGVNKSRDHMDATGYTSTCDRTDPASKLEDRVLGWLFPGHKA